MRTPIELKKGLLFTIVTNLTFWVLIAIVGGALLGSYCPDIAVKMKIIGDLFIKLVKIFIGPIIFLTIVLGISGMGDLRKVGRIGIKSLIYFEIVTTFALIIGIVAAYIIQPGKIDKTGLNIQDASEYTKNPQASFDWWTFFADNFTLQVLLLALISGVALNYYSKRESTVAILYKCSQFVFKALKLVMYLAPLGAFGGMAYTVGKFGLHTLIPLGKLMFTVYVTMAIFIFFYSWRDIAILRSKDFRLSEIP